MVLKKKRAVFKNREKYIDKVHRCVYNGGNKRLCNEQTFVNAKRRSIRYGHKEYDGPAP